MSKKINLSIGEYHGDVNKRLDYITPSSPEFVFSNSFMQKFTQHQTFNSFLAAIKCNLSSYEDLEKLQDGEFDHAISTQSDFKSWAKMAEAAFQFLVDKK